MNGARTIVGASMDADRLCAIVASAGPAGVRVRSWVSAQVPTGVDPRDPAAIGGWLRQTLEKAGGAGSRIVLGVPRGEVVIKRMRLPRAQGPDRDADLASMVRLQMIRQLNFAIEGAAIDYMPIEDGASANGHAAAPAATMIDVLAGALPGERMAFLRGAAGAAGLKIDRVGLRSAGAAALLAQASRFREGSVLGVAAGWASIEFLVVERGRLVFARSADFGLATVNGNGSGEESLPQRVAVEAKRTWMAYRVGHDSGTVDAVAVLGEGALANELAAASAAALELPGTCIGLPETLKLPETMPEADRLVTMPILGLVGERLLVPPSLDFASPRRAPDSGARRRRLAVYGTVAALGLVVAGMFMGSRDLSRLRASARVAAQNRSGLVDQYQDTLLADARLNHIEQWLGADPDWLRHIGWLSASMPDPRQAQLDALIGRLEAAVTFATKDGSYVRGEWGADRQAVFALQGRCGSRGVANELRSRLVASKVYVADSRGADTPDRFDYALTTSAASPDVDERGTK